MTRPATVADTERATFEKAINDDRQLPRDICFLLVKSPSGRDEYANPYLESCWKGWQLARAAGAPAETAKPLNLVRACNLEFPVPDSPHASVLTRNEADREAFCKGWLACTRAAIAAPQIDVDAAPAEMGNAVQRYDLVEKQHGSGHMVYFEKEMEADPEGGWVKFADLAPATAPDVAKDAARYRWLRDNGVPGGDGYADDALLVYRGFGESSLLPDQLDAAIDAAMGALPPTGSEKGGA